MIQLLHGGDRLNTSLCVDADTGVRPYGEHDSGTGVSALYPVTKVLERTRSKWQVRAVVKCSTIPYTSATVLPVCTSHDCWCIPCEQTGEVFETNFFGRVMLLDEEVMITDHDEAHYHEMIAHVPLAYYPNVQPHILRVCVCVCGAGCTSECLTLLRLPPCLCRQSECLL